MEETNSGELIGLKLTLRSDDESRGGINVREEKRKGQNNRSTEDKEGV